MNVRKKRVFISHPLSGNIKENREKATQLCRKVHRQGMLPISPLHLFSWLDEDTDRTDIMHACRLLIETCDEIYAAGDSPGVKEEVEYAKRIGVPLLQQPICE